MTDEIDRLIRKSNRISQTEALLSTYNPNWINYIELVETQDGIQLDIGGFRNFSKHCASIILNDISYGRDDNLYEVYPIFDGKKLTELGIHKEKDVLGHLTLEESLRVALSAMSKDINSFRKSVLQASYANPLEQKKIPFFTEFNLN